MMTDDGLKALATLPRLRHLRLTGPFTDRGVQDLASLPSLKVLWLESPNVSEEALGHLAQSKSLERLCVPWLDRITDRSHDASEVDAQAQGPRRRRCLEPGRRRGDVGLSDRTSKCSPSRAVPL